MGEFFQIFKEEIMSLLKLTPNKQPRMGFPFNPQPFWGQSKDHLHLFLSRKAQPSIPYFTLEREEATGKIKKHFCRINLFVSICNLPNFVTSIWPSAPPPPYSLLSRLCSWLCPDGFFRPLISLSFCVPVRLPCKGPPEAS